MTRPFTVQVGYFIHFANTVTVEAQTLEEALEKAVAAANENPEGWKGTDHVTDTFVDAACEGPAATRGATARCPSRTVSPNAVNRRW